MKEELLVFKSSENRYRTDYYQKGSTVVFGQAEKTAEGVLITEFNRENEVINQVYVKNIGIVDGLKGHINGYALSIKETDRYERIKISTPCPECKSNAIVRELDIIDPSLIREIPVVPMFVCTNCKNKFYSLNREYLENLVSNNLSLFEKEELENRKNNSEYFITILHEYIKRVFAAKKIRKLEIKKRE